MINKTISKDILLGVSIGDALGVPVEFLARKRIAENPVDDMRAFGTHNQPAGTFSDDSSLTFCLAEALTKPFNLRTIANNFLAWKEQNYWTAWNDVFDIGIATSQAISRIESGCQPELAGGYDEMDNGNGSLMRILPLLIYIQDKNIEERFEITKQVSSITHGHIRSVIACFYYLEFARKIVNSMDKFDIYTALQTGIPDYLHQLQINPEEINKFDRLLKNNIYELDESEIKSSGYVVHTLEASIWSLMTTADYKSATLIAVNLGSDTDTTGAVTGGLAGLLYGHETIPKIWLNTLVRKDDIEDLANRLQNFYP